ncbi:MAG: sodium-dependent transporter [Gammaproteobacteria bacterium]|nr:sodium-dependent transporter [Gammaproteobacteria bacterium]MDP2347190.1 sodium-dependent transporter [Gammaproteobacteria bacterium]
MSTARGEFSSRFGFLMATSGSAIGLGNIWGFPTNAASNGGAAFLFTYILMAFSLAYPALMAELIIGRHTRANAVGALRQLATGPVSRKIGTGVGLAGLITVSLILSFYAIIGGWMMAWMFEAITSMIGLDTASRWLAVDAVPRNALFAVVFLALTIYIVSAGVRNGIEKWATRLMPSLLVILILLIIYVFTLNGAMAGVRAYLVPDFSRVANTGLIVSALGQAFFSLSLGVGTMLIYGSYLSSNENLPQTGGIVVMLDTGFSFLAGLLIIPAIYVALATGVQIYDDAGALVAGPGLIVSLLPTLFDSMGLAGAVVGLVFFALMTIAALTSSISMLEVPVAYTVESLGTERRKTTILIGSAVTFISLTIVFNFGVLFDLVVTLTTEYSQPLLGFFLAIFVGWIWNRNSVLQEVQKGYAGVEHSLFWKIWPFYIRYICPLAILAMYVQ